MLNIDRKGRILIVSLLLLIIPARLMMTNLSGSFNAKYYDNLARAFVAGQTYLLQSPDPAMLALPDPWFPKTNEKWRLRSDPELGYMGVHDLDLYHDRFYMHWGPLPALLMTPYVFFNDKPLPEGWLAIIANFIAILALSLCVFMIATPKDKSVDPWLITVTLLTLGFTPHWIGIMSRVAVYEMAVAFGQTFLAIALALIVLAFKKAAEGQRYPSLLAAASLALGMALSCRIQLMACGVLLPLLWIIWCRITPRLHVRTAINHGLVLGLPALGCLMAIGYYNYVRFGDVLQLGEKWVLWAGKESMPTAAGFHFLDFDRVLANGYYFFWHVTGLESHIYGVSTPPFPLSFMTRTMTEHYAAPPESAIGLFVSVLLSILVFLAPWLSWKSKSAIPVNYRSRSFTEGKKINVFRDPWTWLWALVKFRFVKI